MQMDSQESTGKMSAEEAEGKGELIVKHLQAIYKLVEWDDDELGYIRATFHKSGKIELATHIDDRTGVSPTVFEMNEVEEAQKNEE